MNLRTAALLLNENLVALDCQFQTDVEKGLSRVYTFVADKEWVVAVTPGTKLIAQAVNKKDICIVVFKEFAELADLDLDADIEYKFVLGRVPDAYFTLLESAEQGIKTTLAEVKKLRVTKIRNTIKEQLLSLPAL